MKTLFKLKDKEGHTWRAVAKHKHKPGGVNIPGFYKVYFKRNENDLLFKTDIFTGLEIEEIIKGTNPLFSLSISRGV